jgi:hypothetical protein
LAIHHARQFLTSADLFGGSIKPQSDGCVSPPKCHHTHLQARLSLHICGPAQRFFFYLFSLNYYGQHTHRRKLSPSSQSPKALHPSDVVNHLLLLATGIPPSANLGHLLLLTTSIAPIRCRKPYPSSQSLRALHPSDVISHPYLSITTGIASIRFRKPSLSHYGHCVHQTS